MVTTAVIVVLLGVIVALWIHNRGLAGVKSDLANVKKEFDALKEKVKPSITDEPGK